MISALPMYDSAATAPANDRLWAGIRDRLRLAGIAAPETLTRGGDPFAIWSDPGLVLAQTCGLPYRARLHGRVALVAAPDHALEGCPAGYYRSVLIVRADDARGRDFRAFRGATLAFNGPLSQSGYAAAQTHAAFHGFRFARLTQTGSHTASAGAVASGRADIAAIDAVSWAQMDRPGALTVIARTLATPALPYITAKGGPVTALREALAGAIGALAQADRAALNLHGIVWIPPAAYLGVPTPPPPDRRGGGT